MPFPKPAVLDEYLNRYLTIRKPYWSSTSKVAIEAAKATGKKIVSTISSAFYKATPPKQTQDHESDALKRTNMCNSFKDSFSSAATMEDWIKIMCALGEQGRRLLEKKYWLSPDPLCSFTLNAVRTLIIHEITSDDVLKKQLADHIKQLYREKDELKKTIYLERNKNQDVDKQQESMRILIYKLADIGDNKAIFDGTDLGLFSNFTYPQKPTYLNAKYNWHKPWCYQSKYFEKYLEDLKNGTLAANAEDAEDHRIYDAHVDINPESEASEMPLSPTSTTLPL